MKTTSVIEEFSFREDQNRVRRSPLPSPLRCTLEGPAPWDREAMGDEQTRSDADEMMQVLEESGALVPDGHFVHISRLHLGMWLNKDAFLPHVERLEGLARRLARKFTQLGIEVVCAPAIGGLVVSEWVARELGVICAFAEHDPAPPPGDLRGRFMLRRGYDRLVADKRVLVVDDVVNTGHSMGEVIEAVRQAGGNIVAGGSLILVDGLDPGTLGLEHFAYLMRFPRPPMWEASECPLCREGVPISTQFGHGAEFVASRKGGSADTDDAS